MTSDPDRAVVHPGATRRAAVNQRNEARASQRAATTLAENNGKRIENARNSLQTRKERTRRMRAAYEEASRNDPELRKRMQNISRSINQGTDAAIRASTGATRTGASATPGAGDNPGDGSDTGDEGSTEDHYDDGHWDDPYHCSSWYWGSFFPYYCNWWFGSWGWGWGWGGGFGYNHGGYYSPYGYYGYYPAYGYTSPAVVYNYTLAPEPIREETVVYVEVPAVETPGPAFAQVTPGSRSAPSQSFGDRAASEYMALGDQAFTEGRYGDAVHYYAKSIQFAPQDGVLYLVLSDALFATGDYHYAAFALRRSLEFNPELASLGLDKRGFYGQPEKFDEQLALLAKFVEDHPIDRDARLVLAANYLFSLNAEEAVKTLDGAPGGVNPNSKSSQLLLAAGTGMLAE